MRLEGHALLSAVRSELEKLRCSAGGQIFRASVPAAAGAEKYSARARAVVALARYSLGGPWYRWESFPALVGGPMPDATQWDQVALVGDCASPLFQYWERMAAQGEVISQDDTPGRILTLLEEKQPAPAPAQGDTEGAARTGRQTTALSVQVGERRIYLYYTGRRQAGENLEARLAQREPHQENPLVRSEALRRNQAEETHLIRCHCLAHGRRQCSEWDEVLPAESAVVVDALKSGYEQDEEARAQQLNAPERLADHQPYSGPIMKTLKAGLEQQTEARRVEPNSSLGKALGYLLGQWPTLTRFLTAPGAPLDNNVAERALKLCLRQRKNSVFSATEPSADIARVLTSVIAPWVQAGVNALEYLVALQAHRPEVFAHPSAWLPWNYPVALVPSSGTGRQSGASCARSGLPFHKRRRSSRADSVTLGLAAVGHQWQRPWERRLVQSHKPWPASARRLSVVPVRLRKPETAPPHGFSAKVWRHRAARPSRPWRKSTGCTARKMRLWGVSGSLSASPERSGAGGRAPG
jgi:transposase